MDSFESIVKTIFESRGYWVQSSYKVCLTKEEKREIGKPSSPRRELDLVAYKGSTNEILAIECKSFLDSPGVQIQSFTGGKGSDKYKMFNEDKLREVVFRRMKIQLIEDGLCKANPKIKLCLATGKVTTQRDRDELEKHFSQKGWHLYSDKWIKENLLRLSESGYENEVSIVATKILSR